MPEFVTPTMISERAVCSQVSVFARISEVTLRRVSAVAAPHASISSA